jgi:hypothetical protein
VFAKRALRRIFEPMKNEVTGDWKNCIRRSVTCTLIIRMIKSRRMR